MSFFKRTQDVEKLVHQLALKGWRVLYIGAEHELDEKPTISIRLQYDPTQLTDVI